MPVGSRRERPNGSIEMIIDQKILNRGRQACDPDRRSRGPGSAQAGPHGCRSPVGGFRPLLLASQRGPPTGPWRAIFWLGRGARQSRDAHSRQSRPMGDSTVSSIRNVRDSTADQVHSLRSHACAGKADLSAATVPGAAHCLGMTRHFLCAVGALSTPQTQSDGVALLWPSHHSTDRDACSGGDVYDACRGELTPGTARCGRAHGSSHDQSFCR
jgi:hypothetical protein